MKFTTDAQGLGRQIRSHRLRCSITQEQLAERLGVTAQAVSKWETGAACPDILLLPELSAALGVTVDELFESGMETHLHRIEQMMENEPHLSEQDYNYAQARLTEGTLDRETRPRCLTMLAELNNHRAQMYRDRAADYARQALELEPTKKANHSALNIATQAAVWDWCCTNHTQQIDYYYDFIQKHPDYHSGYLWLLDLLIADGRLAEATQVLEKMHRIKESYHYPLYKGWIAHAGGNSREAEEIWNEMVEADPDNWYVWSCRGDAWAKRAEYARALADYRRAAELEKQPRMTDNYESIAQVCLLMGDKAGAAEAYRKVVEILREDWEFDEGETITGYLENIHRLTGQ